MHNKRITIISGHFGSGKTNVAVNLAFDLKKEYNNVALADIDIVNPYFRSKDSEKYLRAAGIRLICSEYANTNIDIPALPQDIYAVTDDKSLYSVLDVGGDDRGALALGRIAPAIKDEGNYEMLCVVNKYRPLTSDADSALEIMAEIEQACGIKFTGVVNNSNLGRETTADDVLESVGYAEEIAERAGIPVVFTAVDESLYSVLDGRISNLYSLKMQKKL